MIIISQDKTEIINFNNVVRLEVSNNTHGQALIEVHNFCDDFETVIGLYKTEERAKEVLQEIINLNIKFELYKTMPAEGNGQAIMLDNFSNNNIKFDTYEMPKE